MNNDPERLSSFFYDLLEDIHNVTSMHRTYFPTKNHQSLNFITDLEGKDSEYVTKLLEFTHIYSFFKIGNINQKLIDKWKPFGVEKPVPISIEINNDMKDIRYSYKVNEKGEYAIMHFKFGGRNFSLPIERVTEITYAN